jgi:hypothetical protein
MAETILFCEDEDTRAALMEAGADLASVFTRAELRVLIEQHTRAPITAAELLRFHSARRAFKMNGIVWKISQHSFSDFLDGSRRLCLTSR